MSKEELQKPTAEEEMETAERTRKALGAIIDKKISAAQPHHVKQELNKAPVFVRYTPSQAMGNDFHNSGAKQRVIRLQEIPIDPMEPPKYVHKKLPNLGNGSPPVPVVHSPPRKLTVADQMSWKVPPCVSNWKNIKGYVIPLDKRMAADGRGLQDVQINSKFAKLSESLYHAEQSARKEIEERASLQVKLEKRKKQLKEEELRNLATKAREEGLTRGSAGAGLESRSDGLTEADIDEREQREELRRDRQRTIKRDLRMEHMGEDRKAAMKARLEDRDVGERIALGEQPKMRPEAMFDQRLFNQDSGIAAPETAEDSYNVYDKPLFRGSSASQIYRPKKDADSEAYGNEEEVKSLLEKSAGKFQPDRGFQGAEKNPDGHRARDKPVAFEKEAEPDPFNMALYASKDTGRKNALDAIGRQGHMSATGGGSHGQDYSRRHDSSKRGPDFTEASARDDDKRSRR